MPALVGGVLGLLLIAGFVLVFLKPIAPMPEPGVTPPSDAGQPPTWAPPIDPPVAASTPGVGNPGLVDAAWADETAAATGIPRRALLAYAGTAIAKAQAMPECALSWTTLAGVGATESDHGRFGGSAVGPDGTVNPPIFGIALDGGETANVPDSDGGALDGDATIDRAVGPMQLIPQTWRNWHTDGGGDGVEDPQNIEDAVAAAANYLCRSSIDMDTEAGWRAAIGAYNSSNTYLSTVAGFARSYNEAVAG
ncbi:hypothetical protein BH11ACT3_BH11ACT3_05690 [soil metagenome]